MGHFPPPTTKHRTKRIWKSQIHRSIRASEWKLFSGFIMLRVWEDLSWNIWHIFNPINWENYLVVSPHYCRDVSSLFSVTSAVVECQRMNSLGKMPATEHAVKNKRKNYEKLSQAAGYSTLLTFIILALAWISGFASRLFAVIRFESIIHEFDPWYVSFDFMWILLLICVYLYPQMHTKGPIYFIKKKMNLCIMIFDFLMIRTTLCFWTRNALTQFIDDFIMRKHTL